MANDGLFKRVGDAWRVIRGKAEIRKPRRYPLGTKTAPFVWPKWREEQPEWSDLMYEAYVKEGYEQNALVFAAHQYLTRSLTSAPLRAYVGDPDNPAPARDSHPLQKIVTWPNEHQSFVEMMAQAIVYFKLAGNSFFFCDREREEELPTDIYGLRPDRVFIVPKDGKILGYIYKPEGISIREAQAFLPWMMRHVKIPNPRDPLEGMGYGTSPMMPLAQSGDVDNEITAFLKKFFERGVMVPSLLKFNHPMDESEIARVKERWKEIYGGAKNWAEEIGVLDADAEYQRAGLTFQEMEFDSLDMRNEARILMALGVPPILVGSQVGLERATYSNYSEARRTFWEDIMIPELLWFQVELQRVLKTPDGGFVRFDTSKVPALQRDLPALAEGAYKLWQMGAPFSAATAAMGLRVEEFAGADVPLLALQRQQVGPVEKGNVPPSYPPKALWGSQALFSPKVKGMKREEKRRIWKALDDIAVDHEDEFLSEAQSQFKVDQRGVLAIIGDQKQKALVRKQGPIQWADAIAEITEYYETTSPENWREAFVPLIEGMVNDVGEFWSVELGVDFSVRNWRGEEWFDEYMLVFADPISETSSDTLHEILAVAQEEGWSFDEMQKAIELTFQQWMDGDVSSEDYAFIQKRLPPWRSEAIARTETTRSSNVGTFNLGKEWGVQRKEWLAQLDDRTRDSHIDADEQQRAIDEPFNVGGYQMDYPGDASHGADPSEFVNCRCSQLLLMEDE